MEHWNNKNAVIRDLERVSRGRLKVDINPCLTAGKPLTCFGEEETEEEFFKRHCSGDANFDSPDLDSIKKLLFMVQGDQENYEEISDGAFHISKLNAKAAEFIPNVTTTKTDRKILPKAKEEIPKTNDNAVKKKSAKVKRGNVAITSILAKQLELIKRESLERKLFKPEDFTLAASEKETSQNKAPFMQPKVNSNEVQQYSPNEVTALKPKEPPTNLLKTNNHISIKKNNENTLKVQNGFVVPAFSSPSSMFRKKTPKVSPPQENIENLPTPDTQGIPKRRSYVPSPYAAECYKKFVENSEVRKVVGEDLWSRTMRQMKIIDKKREEDMKEKVNLSKNSESVSDKTESVENLFQNLPGCDFNDSETHKSSDDSFSASSITTSCASTLDMSGFPASIQLPQYRHLLTGQCEVCKAVDRTAQARVISKTISKSSIELSEHTEETSGDALKNSVDASENSVDASDNSVDALETSVDTSEKNVDALENSVEALETSVDALENSVDTSENLIEFSESSSMCSPSNGVLIDLE